MSKKKRANATKLLKLPNYKSIKDFEFLGSLPEKFYAIIFGMPGSGKTSMCLKLAGRMSTCSSKTLYVLSEENRNTAFDTKFDIFGLKNESIYFLDAHSLEEVKESFEKSGCKNLFIDSISKLNISPVEANNLARMVPGAFVSVHHSLEDGELFKRASAYKCDCDISIFISGSISGCVMTARKNRFGPVKSKEFNTDKEILNAHKEFSNA